LGRDPSQNFDRGSYHGLLDLSLLGDALLGSSTHLACLLDVHSQSPGFWDHLVLANLDHLELLRKE
jgi:hypothetical protein